MLTEAEPFDREFIDVLIPDHQGAIRMARFELEKGENHELKQLAGRSLTPRPGRSTR